MAISRVQHLPIYRFDTLNKHFSNKDLVFGRKPGNGPDDYEHYIENLPAQSNSKFKELQKKVV